MRSILLAVAASTFAACGGSGGGGTTGGAQTPPPASFTIGGTTSGLTGTGLALRNNASDDLTIPANGNFTFAGRVAAGAAYTVAIKTQPTNPDQVCSVANASGTVAAANVTNVTVTCSTPSTPSQFTVGGTVSTLTGTLVLQNNGGDDLTVNANGPFVFASALANGATYDVRIKTQPAQQRCTVSNGNGAITGANVTAIGVTCSAILSVTNTSPADNAGGVARDAKITIQFSAEIDPESVSATSITLASPAGSKEIAIATSGDRVIVTPVGNLLPVTRYTLVITPAIRGARGEMLAEAVTRAFAVTDGQWSSPRLIRSGTNASLPRIGFDAEGNAIALWREAGTNTTLNLAANRYDAGLGWGTVTFAALDTHAAGFHQLAVDATGNAIAVWSGHFGVEDIRTLAVRYVEGLGWEPDVLMGASAGGADLPQVAVDSNGNAIVVWEEFDGVNTRTAWAKRYVVGAGWETGALLGTGSGATSADPMTPQIALASDGNAMAIWRQQAGLFHDGWSRRYVVGAGWGAATLIEAEQASVSTVQIAFDANGNAFAAWDQGTANSGHKSVWTNHYVADRGWEEAVLLEHDDTAPGGVPALAVDSRGNAVVVWQHSDLSRTATDIWANSYVAGRGWTGAERIETQRFGNANSADVAMDSSGNAIAVWKENDGTRDNIWTNRYLAGAGWGIARLLETDDGAAAEPQIAIDRNGNAFAIWTQGADRSVFVSRFE